MLTVSAQFIWRFVGKRLNYLTTLSGLVYLGDLKALVPVENLIWAEAKSMEYL